MAKEKSESADKPQTEETPPSGPTVKAGTKDLTVALKVDSAFGFGTRPAGTVLGTLNLADGIEIGEMITALHNPQRITIR